MKTFRLIGMALLAVCVSFASCSDDDEPSKNDDLKLLLGTLLMIQKAD